MVNYNDTYATGEVGLITIREATVFTNMNFDTGWFPDIAHSNTLNYTTTTPNTGPFTEKINFTVTSGGQSASNSLVVSNTPAQALILFQNFTFGSDTNSLFGYFRYGAVSGTNYNVSLMYSSRFLPTNPSTFVAPNGYTLSLASGQQSQNDGQYTVSTNAFALTRMPQTNQLSYAWATNNALQLTFTGDPASSAVLSYSSNLINWVPVLTNAPYGGYMTYLDTNAHSAAAGFYRGATSN